MIPGEYFIESGEIELNAGRETRVIEVANSGDRPIQVGSHFHFFEVNAYLEFDRARAFGQRLDIPASTALRFEPGDEKEVTLVPYQGKQRVVGFNNLVDGWAGEEKYNDYRPRLIDALDRAAKYGFKTRS